MKKSSFFIMLSVIACSCGFGLTACSSTEEVEVNNPNYDPLKKTVNANFVFSVSTGNTASATRQSSANAQATTFEQFRGIQDAELLAFRLPSNGSHVTSAMTATDNYDLGSVLGPGNLDPDGNGSDVPLSRHVMQLSLPTETNTLMFWGKAPKNGTSTEQGEITFDAANTNISNYAFSLTPRVRKSNTSLNGQDAFKQYQTIMAKALNVISQTTITDVNVSFGGSTKTISSLAWSEYVDMTKVPMTVLPTDPSNPLASMSSLGSILGYAFVTFHTINSGEIRGGAGPAVARTMGDLYDVIKPVTSAAPTSMQDAVAKEVAIAIQKNIELFFNKGVGVATTWLDVADVVKNAGMTPEAANLVLADKGCNLNQFPGNFNVPMGVAQLNYAPSTGVWYYEDENAQSLIGTGGAAGVFDYMFPAELCYYGNSPIRVSDLQKLTHDYPDGVANWDKDSSWDGWTKDGSVQPTTLSVAMQENVNYGTALLESTVRYGSSILEDNNHAIQKAKNPSLSDNAELNYEIEATATAFQLTGIIIGGQPQTVGWDYLAKDGSSANFNYLIYDNDVPDVTIPAYTASGSKSKPNYTLVWDNWSEAQRGLDQSTVYVALEFVNNTGGDFFGRDNKIPAGGTFYIVGKLDPDMRPSGVTGVSDTDYDLDKSLGITWPEHYALPPYDANGNTLKQRRVFMQDYMTVANFVLNRESLQKAYVTIPDLRSSQISLGMSVDLEWQTGLSFDVILGE